MRSVLLRSKTVNNVQDGLSRFACLLLSLSFKMRIIIKDVSNAYQSFWLCPVSSN